MMALDPLNNLDQYPLKGMNEFLSECLEKRIGEINFTGSNTDPLLCKHLPKLIDFFRENIPGVTLGIRSNGVLCKNRPDLWRLFDKGSISVTTFDKELYVKTMGTGLPPDMKMILGLKDMPVKANVVLCPETVAGGSKSDIWSTLHHLSCMGIKKVNLREPYGQPKIWDPVHGYIPIMKYIFGMPTYMIFGMEVTYWDVHYVEVESVNLYANGNVSVTYPITKGHCKETGDVKGQEHFNESGRVREQWVYA